VSHDAHVPVLTTAEQVGFWVIVVASVLMGANVLYYWLSFWTVKLQRRRQRRFAQAHDEMVARHMGEQPRRPMIVNDGQMH
jgi:hypothetical protein